MENHSEKSMIATLSANAGVCITTPNARYWVDAIHDHHEETFSDVTPELWERMKEHPDFRNPDVIIFTHLHGDHFSRKLLEEAMRLYPAAKVILPSEREAFREYDIFGDTLYTFRTMHEGKAFTDVLHEVILLESGGRTVLFTGDMKVDAGEAKKLMQNIFENTALPMQESEGALNTVFAAFPWETTLHGRRAMEEVLRPEEVILYHIPFEKDDLFGYRDGVRKVLDGAAKRERTEVRVRALMEPLEGICLL